MTQEPIQLIPVVQYPQAVPEEQQIYVAPEMMEENNNSINNNESNNQAEMEKEMLIRTNITWVSAFLIGQFALSVIALLNGAFIFFIINSVFLIVGVRGLSTRNRCLLIAHFVYSLIILFGLITVTIILIFYQPQINHFWLFGLSFLIVIETICLRKQRILIQALPKTCRRVCRWGRRQEAERDLEQNAPDDSVSIQVAPVVPVPLFVQFPGSESKQQDDTTAVNQPQPVIFYPQAQGGFQFAQPFVLQAPGRDN